MDKQKTKVQQVIAAILSVIVVACVVIFSVGGCKNVNIETSEETAQQNTETPKLSMPQLLQKIQRCSRLYSTEYKVHKIITHEDSKVLKIGGKSFELPMTDRHIAIPMDATLKAYVDMELFSEKNIAITDNRIVITLPEPKIEVTSSIIQHSKTQEHVSLVRQNYTAQEQENLHRQGLVSITENALNNGILEEARSSAARTLVPMLEQMGYNDNNIEIRFSKQEYNINDLPMLMDSKEIRFN